MNKLETKSHENEKYSIGDIVVFYPQFINRKTMGEVTNIYGDEISGFGYEIGSDCFSYKYEKDVREPTEEELIMYKDRKVIALEDIVDGQLKS